MRDAVIVDAVRTPIGRRKGSLKDWHAVDLSALVLENLAARTGLDPALVDDLIWGTVTQVGEQSNNVARWASIAAGWPPEVGGTTIDRQCGSSQQAAQYAAAGVVSGQHDIVIAGGVETMTRVPVGSNAEIHGAPFGTRVRERYELSRWGGGTSDEQPMPAELIAQKWNLSREELDEFAAQSHSRAAAAQDAGWLAPGIVPVPVVDEDGTGRDFVADEGIRRGTSVETLAALQPVFATDGRLTAGSSSQISDGAAALLITTSEIAQRYGWKPLARFHSFALSGVDPQMLLTGPIPATEKILKRSGLSISDIGHFEINEAFASIPLAWQAEFGADPKALNPFGGAIALGHPLGASGAQLTVRMLHGMVERGTRYGLQAMCEGGGTANATILELL